MNRVRRADGFTLLELMLSLAIVGLVSMIMFSGLQVASRAWQRGDREIELQQRLRILIDHLFEEVKSSYNLILRIEDRTFLLFRGERDRVDFVSTADSLVSTYYGTGLKRVQMYVNTGGSGPQGLVIKESQVDNSDDPFAEEPEGLVYSLAPDVTEMSLRYYAYPPAVILGEEEVRGEWFEFWGGDFEEVESSGEAADTDLETFITQYSNVHLPSGIELNLRMRDPQDDAVEVQLPPIYISLQDCAVHSLIEANQAARRGLN
ncbi:prepilin-type N-terminal cleavage/methylation domain-containing protein [bacterium]|nr:prepilin-type N-terminal cleavage/methylation domain-containing protein [candidate division CSSED10-310 bacterium]